MQAGISCALPCPPDAGPGARGVEMEVAGVEAETAAGHGGEAGTRTQAGNMESFGHGRSAQLLASLGVCSALSVPFEKVEVSPQWRCQLARADISLILQVLLLLAVHTIVFTGPTPTPVLGLTRDSSGLGNVVKLSNPLPRSAGHSASGRSSRRSRFSDGDGLRGTGGGFNRRPGERLERQRRGRPSRHGRPKRWQHHHSR